MTDSSYLALDPGETTGWATFDAEGNGLELGQFKLNEIVKYLDRLIHPELKMVIIEDYKNHAWVQQKNWTRNQTSKNIGKIEMTCDLRSVKYVLQPNTIKGIGYKWAGVTPATNHAISHQLDAYVHGIYWLQSNDIRPVGKALLDGHE